MNNGAGIDVRGREACEGAKANVSNLSFGYFEPSPLLANIQGMPSLREMCVIQGLPLRPRRATLLFTEKQDFQMR